MTVFDLASLAGTLTAPLQGGVPDGGASGGMDPGQVARGFRFLTAAYTVIWLILAVYIMTLSVRVRRLSRQVRRLKERLGL